MSVRPSRRGAGERIAHLCAEATADSRRLRVELLTEIHRVVPFDAHVWLLTDPLTTVGTAPLADVPVVAELPELIRRKYLTRTNRWTSLDAPAVVRLRDVADDPWAAMLLRHGVASVASVPFRDRFGIWGWLDLWRVDVDFTSVELDWLATVEPDVTAALRACQAAQLVGPRPAGQATAPTTGPSVLLLSQDLELLELTPHTRGQLDRLVPPSPGRSAVPADAYNVGAQLLAGDAGVDPHPAYARTHLGDGLWVTVKAAHLDRAPRHRLVAMTIETATATELLPVLAAACGLSRREAEVLASLLDGTDTRGVAKRLGIAVDTVQEHLTSIFAKTATRSRAQLLGLLVNR